MDNPFLYKGSFNANIHNHRRVCKCESGIGIAKQRRRTQQSNILHFLNPQ